MENYTFANITVAIDDGISKWTRYTFICFLGLVAAVGIPGNFIVVAVLTKLRGKTSTDYYVLTMSCIDIFSATVNTLSLILRYEPSIWNVLASVALCRLHIVSIFLTNISSTLLLAATAFDRYRKTKTTSTRDTVAVITKARRICIGIIISSFVYGMIYLFTTTFDSTSMKCVIIDSLMVVALILSSVLSLVFLCMFVIVIFCYTRISIIMWRHHRQLLHLNSHDINIQMKPRFCNKKTRIQPLNHDVHLPSTSKENSAYVDASMEGSSSHNERTHASKKCLAMSFKIHERERKRSSWIQNSAEVKPGDSALQQSQRPETSNCNAQKEVKCLSPKTEQPRYKACTNYAIERDRKRRNVTTLMMFLVTSIYVTTWVVTLSAQVKKAVTNMPLRKADFLLERLYMINCVTTPVLFILMSSRFRQRAREFFCK